MEAKAREDFEKEYEKQEEEVKEKDKESEDAGKWEVEDEAFKKKKEEKKKAKAKGEAMKEDRDRMHEEMDAAFDEQKEKLDELRKQKTMDDYLKTWSKIVENTMLKHLDMTEEEAKKSKGRGQVGLKETEPRMAREEEKIRNPTMQKANRYLRQGRRCDQISYRIVKSREEETGKKKAYRKMNKDTINSIKKDLIKGDKEEEEFKERIDRYRGNNTKREKGKTGEK